MAKLQVILPDNEIKNFQKLADNTEKILGEMTKAGAKVVQGQIKRTVPISRMSSHVKLSRVYKTPTDGGINTKVYLSGYLPFGNQNRKYFTRKGGNGQKYSTTKGVPVDFLANIYEYGRKGAPFPKKPFIRPAFLNKKPIENAMKKEEENYWSQIGIKVNK